MHKPLAFPRFHSVLEPIPSPLPKASPRYSSQSQSVAPSQRPNIPRNPLIKPLPTHLPHTLHPPLKAPRIRKRLYRPRRITRVKMVHQRMRLLHPTRADNDAHSLQHRPRFLQGSQGIHEGHHVALRDGVDGGIGWEAVPEDEEAAVPVVVVGIVGIEFGRRGGVAVFRVAVEDEGPAGVEGAGGAWSWTCFRRRLVLLALWL